MAGKSLAGSHILVVEDDIMNLLLIEGILVDLGASVTTAATADQALTLIDAKVFDVAMLDVNLNGIKSYPVADALTACGVPFAFTTGYSERALRDGYHELPVLQKPFRAQQLVSTITRLLAD
jgi:CheY-like chemotaxis protein